MNERRAMRLAQTARRGLIASTGRKIREAFLFFLEEGVALFPSVLFKDAKALENVKVSEEAFEDLFLGRLIDLTVKGRERYDLKPFFTMPVRDEETIVYRQEVARDLEDPEVRKVVLEFSKGMVAVHQYLQMLERLDYEYNKKGWFLEAVLEYCRTVKVFSESLERVGLRSEGLKRIREYLIGYARSPEFSSLFEEALRVKEGLSRVRYCLIVEPGKFSVKPYKGEKDYAVEIEAFFSKFKEEDRIGEYSFDLVKGIGMSHVEAKILDFVRRLYPEPFEELDTFCENHRDFLDEVILNFEREVQFFLAYLDFIEPLRERGLPFCYPEVRTSVRDEFVEDGFDLMLAHSLMGKIVTNSYRLDGIERVIVVTGPNQGGKTSFARMVGQIHYLACLGLPVPARRAKLFLVDAVHTHFEREEHVQNMRSKLEDDLLRMKSIIDSLTPNSLVILNEAFSSATLRDSLDISLRVLEKLLKIDCFVVWVTFLDELSRVNEKVVSMVALVSPQDPTVRTFKVVRKRADGRAYALSLARKYGLTYEEVRRRIRR